MTKRSGQYVSQPTGYKAFIPTSLPPLPPIVMGEDLTTLLDRATRALARLDGIGFLLPNTDLFITMFLKKEALLSAQIEGTQASLEDIFDFESGKVPQNINDVTEVINYIKALHYGVNRLKTFPMSLRLIKELHAILLHNVRGDYKTPGEFKRSQNWIGARGCTLKTAAFVPPPPEEALKALGDLEGYLHAPSKLPPLIDCALMHYQFETIPPFLDGNGRIGRLLITFYLLWKGVIDKPLLYLSYFMKKNRQEYYDRLTMVREKGDYEQWVTFFLNGVIETSESAFQATKKILMLHEKHRNVLYKARLSSPFALKFLEGLFYTPIIAADDVSEMLKISYPSAVLLLNKFVKRGILKEITGQKRHKRYAYHGYLAILSEGAKPQR